MVDKPAQLSSKALSTYVKALKRRGVDVSAFAVALQRKYAEPFGVLVMALLGMPLAIRFGRRGTIRALCAAVAASLAPLATKAKIFPLRGRGRQSRHRHASEMD